MTTDEVTSHSTGQQYQVRTNVSCKSSNVHFIQGKRSGTVCGQDWCINNHRTDIMHEKIEEKPVAAHFDTSGHSVDDMTVMVIEKPWKDYPGQRKIRESRWTATLRNLREMNLRIDSL